MTPPTPDARRPRVRLRRQPAWLIGGILAVCLGGLASAFLVMNVASTDEVLAVTATVHRGETIESDDLVVVSIGTAEALNTVPSTAVDEVVGQTALVDMPEGALVVAGSYGQDPLADDAVRIGVRLEAGRYPLGLVAGSTVGVVALPSEGAEPTDDKGLPGTAPATLAAAPIEQPDGSVVINLIVTQERADSVARRASGGRLALVEQGTQS